MPTLDIVATLKDSPSFGRDEIKRVLGAASGPGAAEFRAAPSSRFSTRTARP